MYKDFRTVALPYLVHRRKDGLYVVLNREYQQVGSFGSDGRHWDDYEGIAFVKQSIERILDSIAVGQREESGGYSWWLYNDSCVPTIDARSWTLYAARLARLAKAKLKRGQPAGGGYWHAPLTRA